MTIKEIAKQAGVGVSTVSRYLNDGYVSEQKREVIAKIINENNYVPSAAAVNLRGKSNEVAIIIQRISSTTASKFLDGAVSKCLEMGLQPKIYTVNFDEQLQEKYIQEAINKKYLAIVVFSYKSNFDVDYQNFFVIGQKSKNNPCIYLENKKIFSQLTKNTLNNNKINKVYILGVELVDEALINRMQGAKEECMRSNIQFELVEFGFDEKEVDFKLEHGSYYICMTDSQAYRIIEKGQAANMQLGIDYYVSGFGNYYPSNILGLTSVAVDYEQMGNKVITKIINKSYENEIVKSKIITRRSTLN